jgi:hypothetical protein
MPRRRLSLPRTRRSASRNARAALVEELELDPHVVDEAKLVGYIASAAENDWRAAGWLLERLDPEKWSRSRAPRSLPPEPAPPVIPDRFAEVDELARRRRLGLPSEFP